MSKLNTSTNPDTERSSIQLPQTTRWYRDKAVLTGGLGVLCFSFTLPATHLAVPAFGSVVVGLGRALIAAVLAGLLLLIKRDKLPPRRRWISLICVACGVVVGFPLFSAFALENSPVAHGAIISGILPALTAVGAALRTGERPRPLFWLSCLAGMLAVLLFAIIQGGGHLQASDGWMLAAVGTGALGYTEGGRLAREMGGWRVICWALVFAAPFLILPVGWALFQRGIQPAAPAAWLGLGYVAIFSMFLGFFAWYHGLAHGGIARISQLQLLQPLLTIAWAALFLGEHLTVLTGITALLVILCVALGQRSRINPTTQDHQSLRQ